jgi:hypothetical protein
VTYRDELEAARQRTEALKDQLEDKERALADAQGKLEDAAAERKQRERAASEAGADQNQARAALDGLVAKGKQPKRVNPAPRTKPAPSPTAMARKRLLRSITWWGDFVFAAEALYAVIPSFALLGFGVGVAALRLPVAVALPAGALFPLVLSWVIVPSYAYLKLAWLRRWSRGLPYRLEGYPELLELKPRKRESKHAMYEMMPAQVRPKFDPEGHTRLRLVLEFSGTKPADLTAILNGFDPDLHLDAEGAYTRESPVSETYSKGGSRSDNYDDNFKVHKWIRRCHRKALRHLAAAHGLESTQVSLR